MLAYTKDRGAWNVDGFAHVPRSAIHDPLACSTVILPVVIVHGSTAAVWLLMAACAAFGIFASSHWAITQTLAGPVAAGRWTSLQNGVGNLAGIAAPWFTGLAVQWTGSFYVAFLVAAVIALTGAMAHAFVIGPVEQVRFAVAEPGAR